MRRVVEEVVFKVGDDGGLHGRTMERCSIRIIGNQFK